MDTSRRTFLKSSALGMAGAAVAPSVLKAGTSPNEKLNLALIGCGDKGQHHMNTQLARKDINCIALCDVDQEALDEYASTVEKFYHQKPDRYRDYRKLLERPDLDAVVIATPDHWHCLPFIHACEAGKDIYVEKPLANSIAECEIMVAYAKRYHRVVQVGQQQRSGSTWNESKAFIQSGQAGQLRSVNCWAHFNYAVGAEKAPPATPPDHLDYDFWLGPAPDSPFYPNRIRKWRHFWAYGGGLMTDFGAHLIDMGLWVKDRATGPTEILAWGSNLSLDHFDRETFDTMSVTYPMGDYVINWRSYAGVQEGAYDRLFGVEFICDRATVVVDRGEWFVRPEASSHYDLDQHPLPEAQQHDFTGQPATTVHIEDFISAIKTRRRQTVCPIEAGRNVAVFAHAANIAARTGDHRLLWDDQAGHFTNSSAANALIRPEYRTPWELPKV